MLKCTKYIKPFHIQNTILQKSFLTTYNYTKNELEPKRTKSVQNTDSGGEPPFQEQKTENKQQTGPGHKVTHMYTLASQKSISQGNNNFSNNYTQFQTLQ